MALNAKDLRFICDFSIMGFTDRGFDGPYSVAEVYRVDSGYPGVRMRQALPSRGSKDASCEAAILSNELSSIKNVPTRKSTKETAKHPCSVCGEEAIKQYELRPEFAKADVMKILLGFPPDFRRMLKHGGRYFDLCFNHNVDLFHSKYVDLIVKYYFDAGPVTNRLWKSDIDIK